MGKLLRPVLFFLDQLNVPALVFPVPEGRLRFPPNRFWLRLFGLGAFPKAQKKHPAWAGC
jgi:hypothetical protein